ncbi:MAG: serpin family protein [Bacteroidales bacterium]|nr:serpin family protein [Bacteroidales bacterium]
MKNKTQTLVPLKALPMVFLLVALLASVVCFSGCEKIQQQCNRRRTIVLTKTEQAIHADAGIFAFRLFKQVALEEDGGFFISPLSASLALSMTANGTAGNTAVQMKEVLGFEGYTYEEMNGFFEKMSRELPNADKKTQLAIANSLWIREGFPVYDSYKNLLDTYYHAQARELNFDSNQAIKTINNWCANKTNGLIKEIIDEIEPSMLAYLINALYFKGTWTYAFDAAHSYDDTFYPDFEQESTVNYMTQTETFPYTETEFAGIASFPYGNQAYSMVVILPKEGVTAKQVIHQEMTPAIWQTVMNDLECNNRKLEVSMPKFTTEFEKDLIPTLWAMGMTLPFIEGAADFSNLSPVSGLFIGLVKQKTYIEVNEKGTRAAAVTAVGIRKTSLDPDAPMPFTINKSFLYLIVEKSTGTILFMGRQ